MGQLPFHFICSGGCFGSRCRNVPGNKCGGLVRDLFRKTSIHLKAGCFSTHRRLSSLISGMLFAKYVSRCCSFHFKRLRCHDLYFRRRHLRVRGCRKGTIVGCYRERVPCAHIVRRGRFRFNGRPRAIVAHRCPSTFAPKSRPCCPIGSREGVQLCRGCGRLTVRAPKILFNKHLTRCTCFSVSSAITTTLILTRGRLWGVVPVVYCLSEGCQNISGTKGGTGASVRRVVRSRNFQGIKLGRAQCEGIIMTFYHALFDILGDVLYLHGNSILMLRCPLGGCCTFIYGVTRLHNYGIIALVRSLNDFHHGGLAVPRRVTHLSRSSYIVMRDRHVES